MFFKKEKSQLQNAIDKAVSELDAHTITSDEYATIVNHMCKMQELENKTTRSLDPNTMLTVAAHIAGVVMIIKHEQFNVITSKALGFIPKMKS